MKFFHEDAKYSARFALSMAEAEKYGESEINVKAGDSLNKAGAPEGRYSCETPDGNTYVSQDETAVFYYLSGAGGIDVPLPEPVSKAGKKLF